MFIFSYCVQELCSGNGQCRCGICVCNNYTLRSGSYCELCPVSAAIVVWTLGNSPGGNFHCHLPIEPMASCNDVYMQSCDHIQSCDHMFSHIISAHYIFQPCSQNCLRTSDDVIAVIRGTCEDDTNCRNFTLTNDRSLVVANSEYLVLIHSNSAVIFCVMIL